MNAAAINLAKSQTGVSQVMSQAKPDTCTIQRAVAGALGAETWTAVGTAVACRLMPNTNRPSERDMTLPGRMVSDARWIMGLPAGQDVAIADRILFGTRTFKVTEVQGTSFEVERRALLTEMVKS